MANSAGDARGSELEIRKKMLEDRAVDVMISVGPNFFYTVTLPCTLWFLDRGKKKTKRKDQVLFIDARHIFRQIDRAHRDWTPDQIEFISNIVRLYRGEAVETDAGSRELMKEKFPKGQVRRCSWVVQGRHACRNRSARVEPQSGAIRGRGGTGGRRFRVRCAPWRN